MHHPAPQCVFTSEEFKILKNLRNDNSIFVMKPDKGNGVVILNRYDYYSKMETILDETSKFKLLEQDLVQLTFKRENKVRRLLSKLKADNVINDELYNKLAPTGSKPGISYGLPRVHKPSIPLRPIVPSINSHSFPLAKYLVPLSPFSTWRICSREQNKN